MGDMHEQYDPWGVGEALYMGLRMFTHSKRATGRTTLLVNSLKDGDIVVAATEREARRIAVMAKERGLHRIDFKGIEGPDALRKVHETTAVAKDRRVVFDHTFFEALYYWTIRDAMTYMANLVNHNEQQCSKNPN